MVRLWHYKYFACFKIAVGKLNESKRAKVVDSRLKLDSQLFLFLWQEFPFVHRTQLTFIVRFFWVKNVSFFPFYVKFEIESNYNSTDGVMDVVCQINTICLIGHHKNR